MKANNFELVLCDLQGDLCNWFTNKFEGCHDVTVHHGDFMQLDFDCIVSAANSFGLMDGGVDGAITMYFGEQLQQRIQKRIIAEYRGEQPVGTSFIIKGSETGSQYVAHTPTMRVPKDIRGTDNVYQAMKAMLIAVNDHNEAYDDGLLDDSHSYIRRVVCTGLGTFCGKVGYERAATEMRLAYHSVTNPPTTIDWNLANDRNNAVFLATVI